MNDKKLLDMSTKFDERFVRGLNIGAITFKEIVL